VVVLTVLSFGADYLGIKYNTFFGKMKTDAQHEIFKENKAHVEGMIDDLAKYKYQYIKASSDIEKEAIASMINSVFANFDITEIEDADLVKFLKTIRKGELYE